ncbi:two-component system, unclassified family, sensor histidine kinase and response regulator [Pseudoalteromonas citrea]|uniref:Sensory/regulatory protein RpfC n=2 Tax=Pseudoalteromonas citrea TaxID=43655 RepID=A0AAD4AKJ0_9GAMM|nr:response regulator [Pseudoalteromonas citrea]KAF7774012.1 two-component system, unclassified family, sensor histidine kinase and response regulator [Pseudoalteromonas citrea]
MSAKLLVNLLFYMMSLLFVLLLSAVLYSFHISKQEIRTLNAINTLQTLTNELKHSSDLLTNYARNYSVTGEKQWFILFNHVLAIRNGYWPAPKNPINYWDNLAKNSVRHLSNSIDEKNHLSIIERIAQTGIRQEEIYNLTLALDTSDQLVKLEERAFTLLHNQSTDGKAAAQDILFGQPYLEEKAKIMNAIAHASKVIDIRKQAHRKVLNEQATNNQILVTACFTLTFLMFLFSYIMLRVRYFLPIRQIHKAISESLYQKANTLQLPTHLAGELGTLAKIFNTTLSQLNSKIQAAGTIEKYHTALRGQNKLSDVIQESLQFVALQYGAPSCGIFMFEEDDLKLLESAGSAPCFNKHSPHVKAALKTKQPQCLGTPSQTLIISKNEQRLELAQIQLFPLIVNDCCIGILYLGCVCELDEYQRDSLEQISRELAVSLEISSNNAKQQEIEAALSQQLELTHHIINAIPNPTYYRDKNGVFMGVNRAFLTFLNQFEVDVIGGTLDNVFDTGTASLFHAQAQKIFQQQMNVEFELVTLDGQDNAVELIVYEAPFFNSDGQVAGIVGMLLDVTQRNELERELVSSKDLADRSARVKGEFLANMSHEIRTPMNAIIGMAHLALSTDLNPKQHNYVSKIDVAAKQLLHLINDILDFSKIDAGKIELEHTKFELDQLLDNVMTVISVKAQEKQLELIFDVPNTIPNNLIGDPLRLGQILINLAGNAVKFTEKGHVSIQIRELEQAEETTKITFSVIDTGIGMNPQQQQKLFKSFSQADTSITRKYGGTGLGLTISQQLVKLMGGEIYIESTLGGGSTFYFTLELSRDQHTQKVALPTLSTTKNILIVDDNAQAIEVLHDMLVNMNATVSCADSAIKAIDIITTAPKPFDALIIDWQMPEMDGLTAIEILNTRSLLTHTKVLLTTAYGRELELKPHQKSSVAGVVLKPINASHLFDTLISCLGPYTQPHTTVEPVNEQVSTSLGGISILLAEDQPVNQEIAVEILSNYGAKIDVANDGVEALKKIAENKYDVVLMDMQMPNMGGIQATQAIRKQPNNGDLPIIAMTANAMQDDITLCLDSGMNDHISKPIDVPIMIKTIQANLGSMVKGHEPCQNQQSHETLSKPDIQESTIERSLEGINIEEGIERAAGNKEIYFNILTTFLSQQVEELINLKQAIAITNYELAANILHAIKGAAANLSIYFITEKAKTLEIQLKGMTVDIGEIDIMIDYVNTTLAKCPHVINQQLNDNALPELDTNYMLDKLAQALQEFDTSASDLVLQLTCNEYLTQDELEELKILIARFEFAQAQTALGKIQHKISESSPSYLH